MRSKIMITSFILFVIFFILICTNKIYWLDENVYKLLTYIMCEPVTLFFKFITHACGEIIVPIITVALCFKIKDKYIVKAIVLNLILIVLLNQSMKFVIQRERPNINQMIEVSGYSFPSGHTMVAVAFYGYLVHLIYRKVENKKISVIGCTSLTILIILVPLSRIYLGVHYASDILAGVFISLAYLKLYTLLVEKNKTRIKKA